MELGSKTLTKPWACAYCRENILKIHAQKYMAYAEDVYRRSYQIRMGQISEVQKNEGHKFLGITMPSMPSATSTGRKYFFTDAAALDSLGNPVKYYQFSDM